MSGVKAWTAAGFPADQIVLGVASYGHSYSVNHTDAFANQKSGKLAGSFPAFNASNQPVGDVWDGQPGPDVCGNWQPKPYVYVALSLDLILLFLACIYCHYDEDAYFIDFFFPLCSGVFDFWA